jgi:hypothetical protein
MAKYHGQGGRVYMSTTGAATATQVIGLTSWSLDQSTDTVDVTAFEDDNKTYVQGKRDLSGEIAGFWDDTSDILFDAAESPSAVKMYLYPSKDAPTFYWYGTGWVNASVEVGIDQAVAITGSFKAATSWARKP